MILAYGYNQTFKQISLPLLIGMGLIIAYYALLVFDLRDGESTIFISKIVFGLILTVFTGWFVRESVLNISHINQVRAE